MSRASILAGAHHFVARDNMFITANSMHIHNNDYGNRTTSNGVIPLMPNPSNRFTGRTEVIAKLKRHFSNVDDSSEEKFVEEMSDCFSSVFWIDASSVSTITQGLKGICNLPAAQSSGLDGSPESALHWIGLLKENYVMVFDNADVLSPAELEAYLPPGRGGNILITSRNSTMRNLTSPENSLEVNEMEENDAIELLLKASCLDLSSTEFQTEACKIVKELFYLPLAIDQAGAYIASGATTIGDYLAKYSDHRKTLLSHSEFTGTSKYNRSVYGTWELSYKEIWKRAESDDPYRANAANSAMLLLNLFPFFHHEGITEEIFSYAALQEDEESSSPALQIASSILDRRLLPLNKVGAWDNFVFKEGVRILLSFSLIKKAPSDGVYAMHPLVHAWGRDRMTLDERKQSCLMAYVALSCSLRWDGSQPYRFHRVLVTHVRANMGYSRSESNQNTIGYLDDAYVKFGYLLQSQGYTKEAEILQIKVLDMRNRILGVEHSDTIDAMANLATTWRYLEKYTKGEELDIKVLDARNRILGVEHLNTINAMSSLAATYYCLGENTEAEKLDIQVLDARNRILGVEHPDTITAMANLAATYWNLGKYTEAEKLEMQVLDARNRILGVEHPNTVHAMANLAATYYFMGKNTEAEKLEMQVLDIRNRILGVEHPDTIYAMADLAATYRNLGKYTEAEKLDIQVLDASNRILGVEHPNTIYAMASLAATYRKLGKYTEAEKHQEKHADIAGLIKGVEDVGKAVWWAQLKCVLSFSLVCIRRTNTIIVLKLTDKQWEKITEVAPQTSKQKRETISLMYAHTSSSPLWELGALDGATNTITSTYPNIASAFFPDELEIQILDASNRIFGVEHPTTLSAMANLAATYRKLGKYTEAEKLDIQVLDARNRILGVEHPNTVHAMANLAATYHFMGKNTEAEKLEMQVLDTRNRILGVEHPDAIYAMADLAATYRNLGKYAEAEKLDIQVLDARNRILGVEHPNTIDAMENLSATYQNLGKYTEAEKLDIQVMDARNRILGVEHPHTIDAMANLATTYRNLGKYAEAEKLDIQVLDTRNRILGVEHPNTIYAMANLAATYRKLGKSTEAVKLDIQVLDARNRILGVEHPHTIDAMENLAATYQSLGKYTEAEKLYIQVLDGRNRILGVEHPHTINVMANLAATYQNLGKYTEAEKLEMQVLDTQNRILGVEHLDTIKAMSNIALRYRSLEKYTEAEKLETQAYELRNRIPGAEFPHTIATMANIQEAQEIQVLDAGSTVPGEESLHST
ncbi:hypothetical protein K443DRAFT_7761 [Laccaria amethystina LaAM-08-1]|uniref:TPR-like protein n=1 Tax=Laccaria amethystina LaAM-08-1 TaxID=1095629 RepID=A0A0C9XRK7_9AGAR|nr:hypothetical protein K443DRAFT_7761 [Laccaria amethystina LaAM-08-1]